MPIEQQRVGEYILHDKIGRGSFGEVWRARPHSWHNQAVAGKIPTDPNYIRELQQEGAAVEKLRHPNIVRPLNFDPFADPPYLVFEYVSGINLRQLLNSKRKLPIPDAVAILRQVLAGLDYAHK